MRGRHPPLRLKSIIIIIIYHSSIETLGSQDNEEHADRIEGPTQNAMKTRSTTRRRKRKFIDVIGGTGRPINKRSHT